MLTCQSCSANLTRKMVGWVFDQRQTATLVSTVLNMALRKRHP